MRWRRVRRRIHKDRNRMKEGRKQDERKTEAEGQRVRGIMQGLKFSMQSRTIRIGGGNVFYSDGRDRGC